MDIEITEDRKWEISKQLNDLKKQQNELDRLKREIIQFDEENEWQNRHTKGMNESLMEHYPNDIRLINTLVEKEQLLYRKITAENAFMQECEEVIKQQHNRIESMEEEYKRELYKLD